MRFSLRNFNQRGFQSKGKKRSGRSLIYFSLFGVTNSKHAHDTPRPPTSVMGGFLPRLKILPAPCSWSASRYIWLHFKFNHLPVIEILLIKSTDYQISKNLRWLICVCLIWRRLTDWENLMGWSNYKLERHLLNLREAVIIDWIGTQLSFMRLPLAAAAPPTFSRRLF